MKRALILTWEKFQDHEVIFPYYALKQAGLEVQVAGSASNGKRMFGILGAHIPSHIQADYVNSQMDDRYDLLVIPGGVKALEKLRLVSPAVDFCERWIKADKPTLVICNGTQLLITAKVLEGRTISGYYAIEQDIINAGATYDHGPVTVDKNIVSCPHYDFMGEWMAEGLRVFNEMHEKAVG